jgi:hypothetical protein
MKRYSVKSDEGVTPPIDEIVLANDAREAKAIIQSRRSIKSNDLTASALD